METSYSTSYPKFRFRLLQKTAVMTLSLLSLPSHAGDDDALLQVSMQVGSIVYVLIIVFLLGGNAKVRMILVAAYLSLTLSAYLLTLVSAFEFSLLSSTLIRSILPLLLTIILAILVRAWRKT